MPVAECRKQEAGSRKQEQAPSHTESWSVFTPFYWKIEKSSVQERNIEPT
jgi:hypothetical protein